ncbi:hypothetical protein, partial [Hominenteromicrobium sp.]|uniref:hypothetical protein n=1 Tax=Hominenteromicrobium sp. TaxID=3073581 RepID=UPI003AB82E69
MNCTPFVGQYGTLFKKWGVFVFQREYRLKATPFGQQKRRPNRIRKRSSAAEILYSNYRLQFLTELHFFTVRTFHGEKLHAVRPKRQ